MTPHSIVRGVERAAGKPPGSVTCLEYAMASQDDEPMIEDISDQVAKQKLEQSQGHSQAVAKTEEEPKEAAAPFAPTSHAAALDELLSAPLPTPGPHVPSFVEPATKEDNDEFNSLSKTYVSQQLKGQQSYYSWHSDAERRRAAGEVAAPVPLPQKLATTEAAKEKKIRGIEKYSLLDDSDIVKVYIPLEGDLYGVKGEQVEIEFTDRTLLATIVTADAIFRFHIERLSYQIIPEQSKFLVTKKGQLLLKLKKKNHLDLWSKLRGI